MEDLNAPLPGNNYFLVMWCSTGLETVIDITQMGHQESDAEKANLFKTVVTGKHKRMPSPLSQLVNRMTMRARYNSQRHYEIYSMRTDEGITRETLLELFDADPQSAAELVRAHGVAIWDERETGTVTIR